ncbi:nuclear pore complex protein Nup205 [Cydia pomonella]|uniref:nuclear pore complex protein Nup205 n=1 Tax=Cydia pomonella TaxID=82600 RepID=UPI002ADE740F|nr:nuclear pore complex protein Nup205 [Cydia pomonella]
MDINEVSTTEDLWTPYKELAAVVDSYLTSDGGSAPYAVHTFEAVLRRQAQAFRALPHNPPKNPTSREEIKRGVTEGVTLPSLGKTMLSKELVDEAIIISDMFNVNEYLALELLHTAQRQGPRHPGLARGLLAVLLYYDGRRALLQALKDTLTARDGVCWSINAREDIVKYVTRYVDQLIRDGLLGGVLDSLRGFTLGGQLELLQQHRALPPREHHAKLARSIEGTRKLLAGVVFAASAQRGLERETLLRLINEQTTSPSQGPTGALDEVSLALQMALLYALDLSVLHRREDGEELAKKLPLIQDPELIGILIDELLPSRPPSKEHKSKAGARALCQLSLGLALAALRRAPQSLSLSRDQSHRDEELVDAATDNKVFEYLDEAILSTDLVMKEEYYQRRIHVLITDFIVLMHSKLVEMRVKADEAARAIQVYVSEGLTPPAGAGQSRTRLDALLRCVERLYARDPLGLRHEYWQAEQHPPSRSAAGGRATILYKFVRLSGELVCPALLPGYLRALASVAVPKHTWTLLSRRDALSAHHLLSALRRYHCHLRTDLAPFSETMHAASLGGSAVLTPAARPGKMLVRQEEVEAMIAALKLIAAVAREDAAASAAICETLQWDATNTMFGLMCCQIPIQLKAALCDTLSALGGACGPAGRVWAALEAAQLVGGARGLQADLNEIETRMEEYPLTVSFLKLLISLCSAAPLPRSLGAGTRVPGLDPYVDYVTRVALSATHRPYKKPAQRHQILSLCYNLLTIWLEQYEPSPSDFPPPGHEPASAPPPGFRVLSQLHSQTDLLKLTLATLDEVPDMVDQQEVSTTPEHQYLEECITHILTILERALALERALVRSANEAGRSVLVLGLSKLILEPGPNGGDRLTHCCRVLAHSSALPACAARAAALLARALLEPAAARHLQEHASYRAREIRHWFVECLDADGWPEAAGACVRRAKELVVGILQHTLPSAAPNLSHLLLGYQNQEDISRSALHEPGVGGSPRTCFHSVLDILDAHIAGQNSHERQADDLIESCYRLVYWVCARANTSAPALRLLRARDHFLSRHVRATTNLQTACVATLSSRSWVLRACASEVGCACCARQHAAVAALLRALAATTRPQEWEGEGCLLRRCLSALPVSAPPPPEPQWELFNPTLLAQAIASCDISAGPSSKRISVSRVHALLARDLAALPVSQPQRALVSAEIQKVLDYVTEVNKQRNLAATLTHYYDSWRQLTEIIFCVVPQDLLTLDAKKNLLISILQDLLNKIPNAEPPVIPQLGVLASGTVLLLLVNLRHCYMLQRKESNSKSSDFDTTFFTSSQMQTKSLPLKFILHKILSWIIVSGDQSQKLRVNLYGALLNFLNIVNMKHQDDEDSQDTTYVSRLDASRVRHNKEESSLKSMVIDDIKYYGVNLYSIIGADCVRAGHDACRMVALACIDSLIDIDPRTDWIDALSNQGLLRSLVDSLLSMDEGLREAVEPNPKSLRVIYLYESKMALLTRVAGSAAGAGALLAHGALQALAELSVLRSHPDIHAPSQQQFVPDQADRYRQILIPALALCDALLTTLGSENESCVHLIMHLLYTNVECMDMVLRAAHPTSAPGLLIEVEWLTSVLARCSACPAFGTGDLAAERVARTRLLLAALLPRFQRAPTAPDLDLTTYYRIVCNILTFTRNTVESWFLNGEAPGPLPPYTAVLTLLQDSVSHAHHYNKALTTTLHRLDMRALLPSGDSGDSPAARARSLRRQLQQCGHAACLALHLLWRMAQCSKHRADAPALNGTWQAAPGAVPAELRKELAAAFSERFTQSLLDCAETQSTQRFFLDVIVKDIKTMMQF